MEDRGPEAVPADGADHGIPGMGRTPGKVAVLALLGLAALALSCQQSPPSPPGAIQELRPPDDLLELTPLIQRQFRDTFEGILRLDGRDADAHGALGMWYHSYNYLDLAEAAYVNAQSLNSSDHRWPYYLADIYLTQGRRNEAETALRRSLELSSYAPAEIKLGDQAFSDSRLESARAHYRRALEMSPELCAAHLGVARVALEQERYSDAKEILDVQWLLEKAPEAHYLLGRTLRAVGEIEQAEGHLEVGQAGMLDRHAPLEDPLIAQVRAIKISPRILSERARRAYQDGQFARAVELYRSAVASAPDWPYLRIRFATDLEGMGHREASIQQLEMALDLEPDNAVAHGKLGALLARSRRFPEAEEELRTAILHDPGLAAAQSDLGFLLRVTGRCEEAVSHHRRAVALDPSRPPYRILLNLALVCAEQYLAVLRNLEEDLAVFPDHPELRLLLARLLAASPEQSIRDGQRALAVAEDLYHDVPSVAHAAAIASAYAENGDVEAAVRWQEACVEAARDSGVEDGLLEELTVSLDLYRSGRTDDKIRWTGRGVLSSLRVSMPSMDSG